MRCDTSFFLLMIPSGITAAGSIDFFFARQHGSGAAFHSDSLDDRSFELI